MPSIAENKQHWSTYAWPQGGDEWSVGAGGTPYVWHGTIMPRLCGYLPESGRVGHLLEIACGHGRFTRYLIPMADRYTGVDLVDRCAEACRTRFAAEVSAGRATFHANDGLTLPMVAPESVDLAFSWDSLVHCEREVMESYVRELARVLAPGGVAFLHHSNLGRYPELLSPGADPPQTTGWRGPTMTAEVFRDACARAGLRCLAQEPRTFHGPRMIDCISVAMRPTHPMPRGGWPEPVIFENAEFYRETHNLNRISRMYVRQ